MRKRLAIFIMATLAAMTFVSCNETSDPDPNANGSELVESISAKESEGDAEIVDMKDLLPDLEKIFPNGEMENVTDDKRNYSFDMNNTSEAEVLALIVELKNGNFSNVDIEDGTYFRAETKNATHSIQVSTNPNVEGWVLINIKNNQPITDADFKTLIPDPKDIFVGEEVEIEVVTDYQDMYTVVVRGSTKEEVSSFISKTKEAGFNRIKYEGPNNFMAVSEDGLHWAQLSTEEDGSVRISVGPER